MPTIESLLRVPEAAKLAGISARKFWQLVSSGQSPPIVRIGRCARIRASDFDRWVKAGCVRWERIEALVEADKPGNGRAGNGRAAR